MWRIYILFCYIVNLTHGKSFKDALKYYEFLHTNHVQHEIVKRDLSNVGHNRKFNFKFAGKVYNIDLKQKNDILTDNFMASTIDSDGKEHLIEIDKLQYYKGVLEEDEKSLVIAHIENNMITAEIISNNETVYIEPLDRHENDKKDHMLIYRLSDVIWNLTDANSSTHLREKNCKVGSNLNDLFNKPVKKEPDFVMDEPATRKRRNVVTSKNVCHLILVADYTYYKSVGQSNKFTTMHSLIQVISRVHEIYRTTDFNGIGRNIGFKVERVLVHNAYSDDFDHRYNKQSNGPWNVDQLLTSFSRTNWQSYCLAHLFTYQDFDNGIIGLAYVASPSIYEVGGICTRSYRDVGGKRFLNCGLSSSINWGRRLLTAEADLVTAHEIGHNFGSNHDPSNCQSSGSDGNYIMYAHSVSGAKSNNNKFSSCSRYAIGKVLEQKRHLCFIEQKENTFCGNLIVEEGEECDSGLFSQSEDENQCCTDNCKFRKDPLTNQPYICSDLHDPCCDKCRLAPATKICRKSLPFYCTGETKCNGKTSKCPEPPKLDGDEPCGFSRGNCRKGNCTSLCQQKGKISCSCSAGPNSCKVCCKDTSSSVCVVLDGNIGESDGVTCHLPNEMGTCVNGECIKNKRNVEDEFTSLLKDFSFSKFVRFMEANIVGTILVLSLFLWVPASCVVHYIDKKQNEEADFMKVWMNPKSKDLLARVSPGKWKMVFRKSKADKPVRTQYHIPS